MAGVGIGLLLLTLMVIHMSREVILPGVRVAGVDMSLAAKEEAVATLTQRVADYQPYLSYGGAEIVIPQDIYVIKVEESVAKAIAIGKKPNLGELVALYKGEVAVELVAELNEAKLASWGAEIEGLVSIPGQTAELKFAGAESTIVNGEDGVSLDKEKLTETIGEQVRNLERAREIPIKHERMVLATTQQEIILNEVGKMVGKQLEIKLPDSQVELKDKELASFVSLQPESAGELQAEIIGEYVVGLATRFNREPQNAIFKFEAGKVQEFAPAREGVEIEKEETVKRIGEGITRLKETEEKIVIEASVVRAKPQVTNEEVNDLGIVERIGKGESYYAHSIPNRIYNVGLAASRVSSALVAPGEEFSFNKTVGEISAATGYRTAYVIANGRTELGDGGGVCQVSTTLFRAAMDAGLPITERWPHAYRVSYYELNSKPGVDATIYSPSKDLKFVNDTPGHILIQAINDPANVHLIFEIYGTKDGRVATVTEPRVSGVTPPPPTLYQDDPSLPAGTLKQVDWAAWGAKASFDYKVEREGEVIYSKTFTSNYRPWANVFLRGTAGQ